jgi:hypothetical protein
VTDATGVAPSCGVWAPYTFSTPPSDGGYEVTRTPVDRVDEIIQLIDRTLRELVDDEPAQTPPSRSTRS